MNVTILPFALSKLLAELSVAPPETEGILMGRVWKTTKTIMEDAEANAVSTESVHVEIDGHFTPQVGNAVEDEDGILLAARGNSSWICQVEDIVGWFRSSPPSRFPNPSLTDSLRHEIVRDAVRDPLAKSALVFLRLEETRNEQHPEGVKGFARRLYRIRREKEEDCCDIESLQLEIPNLHSTDASNRYLTPADAGPSLLPSALQPKVAEALAESQICQHRVLVAVMNDYVNDAMDRTRALAEEVARDEAPLWREIYRLETLLREEETQNTSFEVASPFAKTSGKSAMDLDLDNQPSQDIDEANLQDMIVPEMQDIEVPEMLTKDFAKGTDDHELVQDHWETGVNEHMGVENYVGRLRPRGNDKNKEDKEKIELGENDKEEKVECKRRENPEDDYEVGKGNKKKWKPR